MFLYISRYCHVDVADLRPDFELLFCIGLPGHSLALMTFLVGMIIEWKSGSTCSWMLDCLGVA